MTFYSPYEKSMSMGTFAGGLGDLLNQFLLYKMIQQMYPGKKKQEQQVPTATPPPRLGGEFDIGSQIQSMAPGQMQQDQPLDVNRFLQMLQMLGIGKGGGIF